ncbi:MAG: hypothetical protein OXD01_05065 [Gammaproteobacteria bacterium]|nr:hypothetical protein [Gammaproteobacteria bacterium]
MKFEEALKHLRDGKKVYRKSLNSLGEKQRWIKFSEGYSFIDEAKEFHEEISVLAILDDSWEVVEEKSLGRILFEAFYSSDPIPSWDNISYYQQQKYENAAQALVEAAQD